MENQTFIDQLKTEMQARYRIDPNQVRIVRSPYRICPIGAHIDHQLGPVTAMAINRAVHLAYVPSKTSEIHLTSLDFKGKVQFSLEDIPPKLNNDWGNYLRGAVKALQQKHTLTRGIVGLTSGKFGQGGLSSSAAISITYLMALEDINGLNLSPQDNIELVRSIENCYLGLKNGILDQSAILLSKKNCLTLIDCKKSTYNLIQKSESMPSFTLLVTFSGLERSLISTVYNQRVEECTKAAKILLKAAGRPEQQHFLGNVTSKEYNDHQTKLSGAPARRAQHFFSELNRVHLGTQAWEKGDLETFGRLMSESGHSSIWNYECGSNPLIDLYTILIETKGIFGARFSGAGFRGCCVALVDPEIADDAINKIRKTYAEKYPNLAKKAPIFTCQSAHGARIL